MIRKLLIMNLSLLGNMSWGMEEIKKEKPWKIEVKKVEKKVPMLKVISLFCADYIRKNKLALDNKSPNSAIFQWERKFAVFQESLVAIKPTYSTWRKNFWKEKDSDNFFALDGNSWILTYLRLKPFSVLRTTDQKEFNFLIKQDVLKEDATINEDEKTITLNKGIQPFFSLEFIQRTCPSDQKIIGDYSIEDIHENYIKNTFIDWVHDDPQYLKTIIDDFEIEGSQEKDLLLNLIRKPNEGINEEGKEIIFDGKLFNKEIIGTKKKIVNYCYNLDAFYRGQIPNVHWLDEVDKNKGAEEIRKEEKIDYYNYYPQTIMIPGVNYISYQKPYTILYGLLIQYAYTFLNESDVAYDTLLFNKMKKFYSATNVLNFERYNLFYKLSTYSKLDEITSYQDLVNARTKQDDEKLEQLRRLEQEDEKKEQEKQRELERELNEAAESIKEEGFQGWINTLSNSHPLSAYKNKPTEIINDQGTVRKEFMHRLNERYQKDNVDILEKRHQEWRKKINEEQLKKTGTSIKAGLNSGFFSRISSWAGQGVSWIQSKIKPILITLGIVGTGTIAWKMWQAKLKKTATANDD